MKKLLYQLPIKNPNVNNVNGGLVLFGLIAMFLGPIAGLGGAGVGMFIMLGVCIYTASLDKEKNALLSIYDVGESLFNIELKGEKLDHTLEGKLSYESWVKLSENHKNGSIYKTPSLSIRNEESPEILLQSTGRISNNQEWGVMREASSSPISVLIQMSHEDLVAIKNALNKIEIYHV